MEGRAGYTLTEVLVASAISTLIVAAGLSVYLSVGQAWRGLRQRMEADQDINRVASALVYGVEGRRGLRAASARTNDTTLVKQGRNWTLTYATKGPNAEVNKFVYTDNDKKLVFTPGDKVVATGVEVKQINRQANALDFSLSVKRSDGKRDFERTVKSGVMFRN